MSFQKSGVNSKLVKYALEAVRIGLIEIVSNEMIIRKSQEAFLNVDLVST